MKVNSPIGDLPFEPTRLKLEGKALVVEGAMGAWPATVKIYLADIPALLRVAWLPLLVVVSIIVGVIALIVMYE
jgi:hypothetical protein